MRQLRSFAATVAICIAMTANVVTPSFAQDGPLRRCETGQAPDVFTGRPLRLDESNHYVTFFGFPENDIRDGDVISVTATGHVRAEEWPWAAQWTPDGAAGPVAGDWPTWPVPGAPKYSLGGFWDNMSLGGGFFLGSNSRCIPTRQLGISGRTFIWFIMNDDWVLDNHGVWEVKFEQWFGS